MFHSVISFLRFSHIALCTSHSLIFSHSVSPTVSVPTFCVSIPEWWTLGCLHLPAPQTVMLPPCHLWGAFSKEVHWLWGRCSFHVTECRHIAPRMHAWTSLCFCWQHFTFLFPHALTCTDTLFLASLMGINGYLILFYISLNIGDVHYLCRDSWTFWVFHLVTACIYIFFCWVFFLLLLLCTCSLRIQVSVLCMS